MQKKFKNGSTIQFKDIPGDQELKPLRPYVETGMEKQTRVVVFTGGRDFEDAGKFDDVLYTLGSNVEIFVGDCPTGLDDFVRERAGRGVRVFEADWDKYKKAAGPIRNANMINEAKRIAVQDDGSAICIAFPGGRGTESCIKEAKRAGITILRVE